MSSRPQPAIRQQQETSDFPFVRDDWPMRLQRRVGLIPAGGLGVARRALLFAAIAWLPIAVWAWLERRFLAGVAPEPFLQHFGIHARCLVAIPLFVLCEATARAVGRDTIAQFFERGLITDADRPRLHALLTSMARLRDSATAWLGVLAAVVAYTLAGPTVESDHEIIFATGAVSAQALPFGAWWFLYVSRAIFIGLLFMWAWRFALWTITLARVSNLGLALVPTHADRAFGLGFLARSPIAFWPLILAASIVIASTWTHELVHHAVDIHTFIIPAAVFAVAVVVIMLIPLLVFFPLLARSRRQAIEAYGALVARHGRLVHGKWILKRDPGPDPLLDAPELGPVADVVAAYDAVQAQRFAPVTKATLALILLPLAIPLIAMAAVQVPIGSLLLKVLSTLV